MSWRRRAARRLIHLSTSEPVNRTGSFQIVAEVALMAKMGRKADLAGLGRTLSSGGIPLRKVPLDELQTKTLKINRLSQHEGFGITKKIVPLQSSAAEGIVPQRHRAPANLLAGQRLQYVSKRPLRQRLTPQHLICCSTSEANGMPGCAPCFKQANDAAIAALFRAEEIGRSSAEPAAR